MEIIKKVIIDIGNSEEVLHPMFLMDLQLFAPDEDEDSDDTGSDDESNDDAGEEEEDSGEEAVEEESEEDDSEESDESEDDAEEESEESEEDDSEETEEDSDEEEESEDDSEEGDESEDDTEEESEESEEDDSEETEEDSDEEEEPEEDGEELDYELEDDDDAFESAADYDLEEEWLEEDNGDWTDEDYEEFGGKVFSDNEHFGESYDDWMAEEGNEPVDETAASSYYEQLASESPSSSFDTIKFYQNGDMVIPQGFLTPEAFAILLAIFGQKFQIENLHLVDPPRKEEIPKPQKLPDELKNVDPKEIVDLRKYCSPIGDQKQTGRCKAYAMTHAFEMLRIMANKKHEELSTNYTMLRTHKLLGKFTSFEKAHAASDGTPANIDPLKNLIKYGICSAKLWPNDDKKPKVSEEEMNADAAKYKIKLNPINVGIEDVKKLLSKGIPVEFYMNTGTEFQNIGRDGILRQAEKPSGKHGCHSMLIVGYIGNYYIVKNSWGTSWGDKGYCYISKKALLGSSPGFAAFVS